VVFNTYTPNFKAFGAILYLNFMQKYKETAIKNGILHTRLDLTDSLANFFNDNSNIHISLFKGELR